MASQGATVADVAGAVSEFYGVSVLLSKECGSAAVAGRVVAPDLAAALSTLVFYSGKPFRSDPAGRIYFFGGQAEKELVSLPSYGYRTSDFGGVAGAGENSVVLGDRLLMTVEPVKATQLRETLKYLGERPGVVLELCILALHTNDVDRVNEWLDRFKLGAGYFARTGLSAAGAGVPAVLNTIQGRTLDVDVGALLTLSDRKSDSRIEIRNQLYLVSGETARFESGIFLEDVTYTAQPNTEQLVSSISRRTVGYNLDLRGVLVEGRWQVNVELADGNVLGGVETTTKYTGRAVLSQGQPALLVSYTRKDWSRRSSGVPLLQDIPGAGKLFFTKREETRGDRVVMVIARPVGI